MDCACHEARIHGLLSDKGLSSEGLMAQSTHQISDRQAAVLYLEAARLTADRTTSEQLRRRGAELIWPRPIEFRGGERSGARERAHRQITKG